MNKVGGGRLRYRNHEQPARANICYGESENKSFHEIIEAASNQGWHTFDQSIVEAYKAGIIDEKPRSLPAQTKANMRRELG